MVPGKTTWAARDWIQPVLEALTDWGIPRAIISDRDPRFLSELWTGVFSRLSVKFLRTTAWHPQSDGQSERTNQTVEIALRYWLCGSETDWRQFLPALRAILNNSPNRSTGVSCDPARAPRQPALAWTRRAAGDDHPPHLAGCAAGPHRCQPCETIPPVPFGLGLPLVKTR